MSLHDEASVEFHLPAVDSLGRLDVDGKVRFADGILYLHWKLRDRTFTRNKNQLETAEIDIGGVEECELDKGWFSASLRIEVKDPRQLEKMPGVDMGKLVVKLDRSQRKPAEKLVSVVDYELSRWRAEQSADRLRDLEAEIESVEP